MKRILHKWFLVLLACLLISTAAGGETVTASPVGTWVSREMTMGEEKYVVVESSVTFYENGTYNGTILQTFPISGEWSIEDGIIFMDDATMIPEDADTMTLYYGEYEFRCTRKNNTELTATEARELAAAMLTGCYDRIDDVFSRSIRAMEAVRQFVSDGKYSSLLRARILCSEVMALTEESFVPTNPFETLEHETLYNMGVDVDHIPILTGMCAGAEGDARSVISLCMDYLFQDYCYTDLGNTMNSITKSYETYLRAVGKMQPLLARMIFGTLWEDSAMEQFWVSIPERWAIPGADFPENTELESLQILYLDLNEQTAQTYGETENLANSYFATLQEKDDSIAAGNYETVRKEFTLPDAMPNTLIPLPDTWLDAQRIRIQTEGDVMRGNLTGEVVLSVLETDGEEYAGFMNFLLPMISDGAILEGNEKDGWRCEIRETGCTLRSEWSPEERIAYFWYDSSQVTLESISLNNTLLNVASVSD